MEVFHVVFYMDIPFLFRRFLTIAETADGAIAVHCKGMRMCVCMCVCTLFLSCSGKRCMCTQKPWEYTHSQQWSTIWGVCSLPTLCVSETLAACVLHNSSGTHVGDFLLYL